MTFPLRYQIVGLLTAVFVGALVVYLVLATRLVSRDKLAYVYDTNSALAFAKSEELRASLGSTADKLLFATQAEGSAELERSVAHMLESDADLLAVEVWTWRGASYQRTFRRASLPRQTELDLDGEELARQRVVTPVPFNLVRAEGLYLQNLSLAPDIPLLCLAVARPDGDEVVVAELHPDRLLRLFASSAHHTAFLIDIRGNYLLHSQPKKMIGRQSAAGLTIVEDAFRSQLRRGAREFETPEGVMLGAFAGLSLGRLAVVTQVPKSLALQGARDLNQQTLLFALLVTLVALVASILLAHRIVSPLQALEKATRDVSRGKYTVEVPTGSRNEIGAFATAFSQMSRELADRESRYMTMVGTLAAGVAHEINNPLAYVKANVDYVAKKLAELETRLGDAGLSGTAGRLEKINAALSDAAEGSSRIRDIVRNLKSFSSFDQPETDTVDVNAVIEAAIRMAAHQMKYRGRVTKKLGELEPVVGSEAELGQVFLNLLLNAAQALPDGEDGGGTIEVSTQMKPSGRILVEVADDGRGIPPEVLGRIFDPFFTTKGPEFASGLGLAISHSVVTRLGGTISADSEPGRGTRILVELPAATGEETLTKAPSEAPARAAREHARFLVIDDDPFMSTTLARILGEEHEVVAVQGGREALDRLTHDHEFDLVFCDLMMPRVTGMDVYEAVAESDGRLAERFVFMTGGVFTERANALRKTVGNPFLDKPFDERVIRQLITERLGIAA